MRHELKTWPPMFQHVVDGVKTFEYRKEDRPFGLGDVLLLREWLPLSGYTGREATVDVVYRVAGGQFGIPDGYCILGVRHAQLVGAGQQPATQSVRQPDEAASAHA